MQLRRVNERFPRKKRNVARSQRPRPASERLQGCKQGEARGAGLKVRTVVSHFNAAFRCSRKLLFLASKNMIVLEWKMYRLT